MIQPILRCSFGIVRRKKNLLLLFLIRQSNRLIGVPLLAFIIHYLAMFLVLLLCSGQEGENDPALYIRGLQALSNNNILVLVDGLERNIRYITPRKLNRSMFCVMPAVALYGYRELMVYFLFQLNAVNIKHAKSMLIMIMLLIGKYVYLNLQIHICMPML